MTITFRSDAHVSERVRRRRWQSSRSRPAHCAYQRRPITPLYAPSARNPSVPDTPHGNRHLLVAFAVTIEREPALAKVVEPSTGRFAL
jgi:hypothetical protein